MRGHNRTTASTIPSQHNLCIKGWALLEPILLFWPVPRWSYRSPKRFASPGLRVRTRRHTAPTFAAVRALPVAAPSVTHPRVLAGTPSLLRRIAGSRACRGVRVEYDSDAIPAITIGAAGGFGRRPSVPFHSLPRTVRRRSDGCGPRPSRKLGRVAESATRSAFTRLALHDQCIHPCTSTTLPFHHS
jgi:hypothetical protein